MISKEMKKYLAPELIDSNGIPPIVIVSGTNYEMGYQYAKQLAEKIWTLKTKENASMFPENGMKSIEEALKERETNPDKAICMLEETVMQDMKVEQYYADKYDPGFREWQDGIIAGCKEEGYDITHEDLMLIATYTSEFYERPVGEYPEEVMDVLNAAVTKAEDETVPERSFCNSFAAAGSATVDGKAVICGQGGSAYEAIDRIILIAFPKDGPAFTALTTIGKFQDQMGLNSAGFAWVMTGNYSGGAPWGMMPEIPMHYLNQYCTSVKEAQDWIEPMKRCGAFANFIMADTEGEISVTETNAFAFGVRKPGDCGEEGEFLVNTNFFARPDLIDANAKFGGMTYDQWNIQAVRRYSTIYEMVKAGAAEGKIDIEFIRDLFASNDWFDHVTGEWHYNDQGADNDFSNGVNGIGYTQLSVLKPEDKTAYFMLGTGCGIGMPAGSLGEFVKIELDKTPYDMARKMQTEVYKVYAHARNIMCNKFVSDKDLKKDFASRMAFEKMLDDSFLEYERGMDRVSYAFMGKYREQLEEEDYIKLIAESMSHFAKAQVYARRIITEMKNYD